MPQPKIPWSSFRPSKSYERTPKKGGRSSRFLWTDQVIEANNASNVGLKKRDVQLACQEDIMDGRVCANRVKIDELSAKVWRLEFLTL